MPNTNVNSFSSHLGESDAKRHGLTPARRETIGEMFERLFPRDTNPHAYEEARQAGKVTYSKKEMPH